MELFNNKSVNELTTIELNLLIFNTKEKHDNIKTKIDLLLNDFDEIEKLINNEVEKLKEVESNYIKLVTELNNR